MNSPSVGVLGLGIIGAIWARHYETGGVLVATWNRTARPDFPRWQESPAAVAVAADMVQIVVADPAAVADILEQIIPVLGPGKTVVQSSTIDPPHSDRFRREVIATGARYLEAPFTGSKPAAEARQTVFYLGGDDQLVADISPTLALVSAHRCPIGDHQQACALKLAMNLNVCAQMQGLIEALCICREAGIDDDAFQGAFELNTTHSRLTAMKLDQIRREDYAPFFSVKHMHKDMRLAADMPLSLDLELLPMMRRHLAQAEESGYGDEDFAALFKMWQIPVSPGEDEDD